jgi:hypothetical protein
MFKKIKYNLQIFQKDLFLFPIAFMALFLLITALMNDNTQASIARSFLGFVLPLIASGLAAYAYLEDKALELKFTTNQKSITFIAKRLSVILIVIILTAFIFQAGLKILNITVPIQVYWLYTQMSWLIPSLFAITLSGVISLVAKSSNLSFSLMGAFWILQVALKGWFAENSILKFIFYFLATMKPETQDAYTNLISLTILSVVCLILTNILIKKQERYI